MLKSNNIFLRTLHSSDAEVMLKWENNPKNWEVSGTKEAFTKEEINAFVNGVHDIKENQQIRYVICLNDTEKSIGTIDLFEYEAKNQKTGIGILIAETEYRKKGYASEALKLIIDYCRNELNAVNLFCNITKDNTTSIRLFEKCGFQFIEERILFKNEVNYYELKM
ncbi:MAG: GNAT family N-acetyltransferase [Flavobacteriales bacterium]|nr:MAG: GNAT family N-acetyltransferase [Flavobacteriales bacterium]